MENKGNEHELMGSMKVSRAVAVMAIPSVISSLVTVLYNMADTFFVGQTGDPLQVAAVSLTNPIFILMMAFANMFGMGGSTVLSMAMGEKNEKRVRAASSFVTYASILVGILFAALLILFMDPILTLFGADAETYGFARGYTLHIAWGAPFIIWSAAASFIVRAEGASREAMVGSMIGTIANIVLDPIFISVLGQGTAGAAIATSLGNIMASAYYLWYFLKKSRVLSIQGLSQGAQPILGYNYGSGDVKRFRSVERFTKRSCMVVGILATLLYFVLREPIIRLFIDDDEVVRYGVEMLTAYMLSGPVIGFLFVNMNSLQSVGHALEATVLSVLRQGVLLIPLLYLLQACFGLTGVIFGQSVTDYIAVALSAVLWRKVRRRLGQDTKR